MCLSNTSEEVDPEATLEKKITTSQRTINFEDKTLLMILMIFVQSKQNSRIRKDGSFFEEIQNVPLWEKF